MAWGLVFLLISILSFESALANCKAIIFSGAANKHSNYYWHISQIKSMYEGLKKQGCKEDNIFVLSASGNRNEKDFNSHWSGGDSNKFEVGDYSFIKNSNLLPGTKAGLNVAIEKLKVSVGPTDSVFVYIADHGTKSDTGKLVSGWNETIGLSDLNQIFSRLDPNTKLKIWTETCYGGFINKIERKNTCTMSSTDENHVADYFFADFDQASLLDRLFLTQRMSLENRFASNLIEGKKVSLESASKSSLLDESNEAFIRKTRQNGDSSLDAETFMGPRDSATDYMYQVLDIKSRDIHVFEMLNDFGGDDENCNCSFKGKLARQIPDIKKMAGDVTVLTEVNEILKNIRTIENKIKSSGYYRKLLNLNKTFDALSQEQRFEKARGYQAKGHNLKILIARQFAEEYQQKVFSKFNKIIERLFLSKATPEQKEEYERRKECLKEPLF